MDTTDGGRQRKRSWPEALKREIVAASFAPGSSVSIIARRYDVNANQVFAWRKRFREGLVVPAGSASPQLVPVMVTGKPNADVAPVPCAADMIEIELLGGYRVRVGGGVAADALWRVLDVLERRR